MTENSLTDSELTWDMLEEETLGNLSDKPTKVAENVRREVALLFRTPSFMREIAHELMLMNPPVKYNSDNNYVKIDDLKEIVGKLMSRNVVGQSLVMLEDSNKHFATTIHHMAENLLQLNVRVNQLAKELQEIAQDLETGSEDKKEECDPMPIRLTGGETNTCGTQQCVTKPDKLRIYNDLICKYNNQRMDQSSNDFSSYSGSSSKSTIAEPLTRLKTETFWSQPSKQLSGLDSKCADTESTTKLHSDYARRVAERRQFEMNMLMYRKSQFSLKLNHRTENFPYSLWNRRYTSEHFDMPHTFQ